MINWWLKISTPTTSTVAQITLVSIFDSSVPPQISYEFQSAPPVQGLGLLNGVTNVEVNGHSLGGHLASAFARLFGASANATGNGKVTIDHITTFNSAGFNGKSNFVFQEIEQLIGVGLGRMPTSAEQTNDFAINGLNVTTNTFFSSQIGQRVEVFNEESTGIPNHFMYKLTDALALGDAIAKLDSSFDINKMNHLFDKGANQTEASLEGILDGLRKTLLGSAVAPTPIGDEGDSPNSRNEYHDNLSFLLKSDDFKNLIGKVTLVAPPTSVSEARSDFGAFLSLVYLTPFALKANDIAAGVQLETLNLTNTELALKWEQDNALTPAQITGGAANYSDMWLADRAHLLAQIVHRNTADSILVVGGGSNESYQDFATGHVFWTAEIGFYPGPGLPPDSKHIIFGDDNANINIQGGTKSDHLYGGGGDDLLTGGKGNDYLEGGADSDIYVFLSGDGMDTILDADGQGKITLDGIQLKGQTGVDSKKWLQAGNAWQDQKNHISYSLVTQTDGSQDLLIAAEHNTLVVKNWHSDELGITLGAPQVSIPPPLPTALEPINGDLKPLDIDPVTNGIQTGINALGNIITDPNQPDPGRQDTLYDSTGNDQVNGLSGNDTIKAIRGGDDILDGGDGDDRIEDQAGNDILKGGAGDDTLLDTSGNDILKGGAGKDFLTDTSGNDTLEGGADSDILLDTSGDNLLYADEKKDFQTYYNQSQTATGTGQQGDLLGSGAGTDQLYGSNSQDAMAGGDGADILMGGADDDILYGDGIFTFTTVNPKWSITLTDVRDSDNLLHHAKQLSQVTLQISPQGGDDIIYGGSGNDFIDGGAGNNILVGGTGRDILIGGKDNDIFYAEEQALLDSGLPNATNAYGDFLSGGKGSDTLIGSDKADALMGGGRRRFADGGRWSRHHFRRCRLYHHNLRLDQPSSAASLRRS
jgi:Ca2+-binding RTX toxin-like protein